MANDFITPDQYKRGVEKIKSYVDNNDFIKIITDFEITTNGKIAKIYTDSFEVGNRYKFDFKNNPTVASAAIIKKYDDGTTRTITSMTKATDYIYISAMYKSFEFYFNTALGTAFKISGSFGTTSTEYTSELLKLVLDTQSDRLFEPTKDYHPATKKYVDDSSELAKEDINNTIIDIKNELNPLYYGASSSDKFKVVLYNDILKDKFIYSEDYKRGVTTGTAYYINIDSTNLVNDTLTMLFFKIKYKGLNNEILHDICYGNIYDYLECSIKNNESNIYISFKIRINKELTSDGTMNEKDNSLVLQITIWDKTKYTGNENLLETIEINMYSKMRNFLPIASSGVTDYTPTTDYQPATKKYVDDNRGSYLSLEDPIVVATQEEMQTMKDNNKYYLMLNKTLGLVEGDQYAIEYGNFKYIATVEKNTDNINNIWFKYQSIGIYDKANLESNNKITSTENDTSVIEINFTFVNAYDLKIYKVKEVKKIDNVQLPDDLNPLNSISIGRETSSKIGNLSSAIGNRTIASGLGSHAEGSGTEATKTAAHAEGSSTKAIAPSAHAEGTSTIASSESQHVQGRYNIEDTEDKYAHIVGNGYLDYKTFQYVRQNAHTLDWDGNAWYKGNVSIDGTPTNDKDLVNKKYVDDNRGSYLSLEEPIVVATQEEMQDIYDNNKYYSTISKTLGLVEGDNYIIEYNNRKYISTVTISNNIPKLIFKYQSIVIYDKAIYNNGSITSTTDDSCVLNLSFKKTPREIKIYKIKELTRIDNPMIPDNLDVINSISLGRDIDSVIGDCSTALGATTVASGRNSHAIGLSTKALGHNSHAEGTQSQSVGVASHAEGFSTKANGLGSHSEGSGTIASSEHQHVQGRYNIEDTENKYAHIVGNGTSSNRTNAHTLDWDGNAWYKGNVSIDGIPTNDKDLVTKKYVDDNKVSLEGLATEKYTDSKISLLSQDNVLDTILSTDVMKKTISEVFPDLLNSDYSSTLNCNKTLTVDGTQTTPLVDFYNCALVKIYDENDNPISSKILEISPTNNRSSITNIYFNIDNESFYCYILLGKKLDETNNLIESIHNAIIYITIAKSKNNEEFINKIKNLKIDVKIARYKFLSNDNKIQYTPTADYHPATKKYVDDSKVSLEGLATEEYVNSKTSLENIVFKGTASETVHDYWTHCPLDDGNGCWVIDKEITISEDIENPYYIEIFDNNNVSLGLFSPKNSTYDATNSAWIYHDAKLNTGQNLFICNKYENENKIVVPWDGLNNYYTLKIFTKTELAESMFSGDYNDLTNKPTIPSTEGLVTEDYVDDLYIRNKNDIDTLFTENNTKILAKGKIKDLFTYSKDSYYGMNVDYNGLNHTYIKDTLCNLYYYIKFTDSSNKVHKYMKIVHPIASGGISYGRTTLEDSSLDEKIKLNLKCILDKQITSNNDIDGVESEGNLILQINLLDSTTNTGNSTLYENGEIEVYTKELNFLPLSGLRNFNPTSSYHPATKKYVDDSVPHTKYDETVYTLNELTATQIQKIKDDGYCSIRFSLTYQITNPTNNNRYYIRCNGEDIPMVYHEGNFICETEKIKIILSSSSVAPLAQEPVDETNYDYYLYVLKWDVNSYTLPAITIISKNNECLKNEFLEKNLILESLVARKITQYETPTSDNDVVNKEYVDSKVKDTVKSLTYDPDIYLSADKYQYVTGVSTTDNIIWLSNMTLPEFTTIHLYIMNCKMNSCFDSPVKWKTGQNPSDGKFVMTTDNVYEFILTYVNSTWLGEFITYNNADYTPTSDNE